MKILAIIPARGGSKGVPGKNIKLLGEKPLLLYAYECAHNSKYEIDIIVSTDDDEIKNICIKNNVKVIDRPAVLAEDSSSVTSAIHHVLQNLTVSYDLIVLLQPTSPFRKSEQLDEIIDFFEKDSSLEGVISVVGVDDAHPARMYSLDSDFMMKPFLNYKGEAIRRQDLDPVYLRNGCFYVVTTQSFLAQNSVMPLRKKAYLMDSKYHVNIDTPKDFMLASLIYDEWKNENSNN
ncbi:acylneuraminate cytidylyltransferase family protein [Flavobacterium hydrophilum]|uniref:CMP-N-acetlyneuraminic acid synthetase n=1 Tax=Flavobacterium hydrophilum TaxID=2211445 RepID=A0A2V4CDD6_9FLAO|nr:acylneuraminate cytidylyltransferase family protein [Flavobacterium hydrophilum]PXY44084.1 CMP-N-acetlyneuraminic acid synthetase [Flavobacterium hydrophilum]